MALFDSADKINDFVEAICQHLTRDLIKNAFNRAGVKYTDIFEGDNAIASVVTFGMHPIWRYTKMQYRMRTLQGQHFFDINRTPEEVLLAIIEGPGGRNRSSFKWSFLTELAQNIYDTHSGSGRLPPCFIPPSHWTDHWWIVNHEHQVDTLSDQITKKIMTEIVNNLKTRPSNIAMRQFK